MNEDEIKDFQAQILLEQEAQRRREREMQEWLEQQRRLKEEAEEARVQQLERERAIAERAEARIQLRKRYAQLEEERRVERERRLEREKAEAEQRRQLEARQEMERLEQQRLAKIAKDIERENELMAAEDTAQQNLSRLLNEIARMEHEDVLSYLYEQLLEQEEERRRNVEEMCSIIYEPFVPFEFKKCRGSDGDQDFDASGISSDKLDWLDVTETVKANDELTLTVTRKALATASLKAISNEGLPRIGLHADAAHLVSEYVSPVVESLLSVPPGFDPDYFYLEACRPGLRSAGILERPLSPQPTSAKTTLRAASAPRLPPLRIPSSMNSKSEQSVKMSPPSLGNRKAIAHQRDSTERRIGIRGLSKPLTNRRLRPTPEQYDPEAPEGLFDDSTAAGSGSIRDVEWANTQKASGPGDAD